MSAHGYAFDLEDVGGVDERLWRVKISSAERRRVFVEGSWLVLPTRKKRMALRPYW